MDFLYRNFTLTGQRENRGHRLFNCRPFNHSAIPHEPVQVLLCSFNEPCFVPGSMAADTNTCPWILPGDLGIWCRRPDLNRYGPFEPRDFKSLASACSATPARLLDRRPTVPLHIEGCKISGEYLKTGLLQRGNGIRLLREMTRYKPLRPQKKKEDAGYPHPPGNSQA
jgi:hypothetical protein